MRGRDKVEFRCRGRFEVLNKSASDADSLIAVERESRNFCQKMREGPELVLELAIQGRIVFDERHSSVTCANLDPRLRAVDAALLLSLPHQQDS